jgi:hypothetical protein
MIKEKRRPDMKFKEFDKKKESEKIVLVDVSVHEDRIRIRATKCDDLNLSTLLDITPSGVYLYSNIDKSIGFSLDEKGHLNIYRP